jgi:hypothetical protein
MSGGSSPHVDIPKEKPVPEEPDVVFGDDEDVKKKKQKNKGTKALQVPLTGDTKSGLGIPS